jgi:hypothetical protein
MRPPARPLLPALPHHSLLTLCVVGPRSILHLQHSSASAVCSVLHPPVESATQSSHSHRGARRCEKQAVPAVRCESAAPRPPGRRQETAGVCWGNRCDSRRTSGTQRISVFGDMSASVQRRPGEAAERPVRHGQQPSKRDGQLRSVEGRSPSLVNQSRATLSGPPAIEVECRIAVIQPYSMHGTQLLPKAASSATSSVPWGSDLMDFRSGVICHGRGARLCA